MGEFVLVKRESNGDVHGSGVEPLTQICRQVCLQCYITFLTFLEPALPDPQTCGCSRLLE